MTLIDFGAKTNNIDEKIINLDKLTNPKEITAGYMSPINIIHKQLYEQMNIQLENNVVKAVAECGIEVNKEELIKALQYDRQQYDKGFNDGYEASRQQWIPCSERLPEESGKYLGQVSWGNITDITFSKKYQKWNAHDSAPPEHAMEVVAWMPLPEPYKVGEIDG